MTLQNKILDLLESILRKSELSDNIICSTLRIIHLIFPNIAAFIIFFGNKTWVQYTILANIVIFILFISFNGCLLSRLEKRFCKEDFTVMDPVLIFFNIPITQNNRVKYSICSALTCFVGTAIIYYFRFVYK